MVKSHEAVRPTELNRVYPNWMAQESEKGTELKPVDRVNSTHTNTLPFRLLIDGLTVVMPCIFVGDLSVSIGIIK
jgi:hypothetical protein